jgi:hypothetical protein
MNGKDFKLFATGLKTIVVGLILAYASIIVEDTTAPTWIIEVSAAFAFGGGGLVGLGIGEVLFFWIET